jgi:hypothetical protein
LTLVVSVTVVLLVVALPAEVAVVLLLVAVVLEISPLVKTIVGTAIMTEETAVIAPVAQMTGKLRRRYRL